MHVSLICAKERVGTALGEANADMLCCLLTIAAQAKRPISIRMSSLALGSGYSKEELPMVLEDCHNAVMHCFQLPLLKNFDPQNARRVYFSDALLGLSRMMPFFEYHEWLQPCDKPYEPASGRDSDLRF